MVVIIVDLYYYFIQVYYYFIQVYYYREFQKNTYFCFIDCAKAFDCIYDKKKM